MRLVGYCTQCKRVRYVTVRSDGMLHLASTGVATGTCMECEHGDGRAERGHHAEPGSPRRYPRTTPQS